VSFQDAFSDGWAHIGTESHSAVWCIVLGDSIDGFGSV